MPRFPSGNGSARSRPTLDRLEPCEAESFTHGSKGGERVNRSHLPGASRTDISGVQPLLARMPKKFERHEIAEHSRGHGRAKLVIRRAQQHRSIKQAEKLGFGLYRGIANSEMEMEMDQNRRFEMGSSLSNSRCRRVDLSKCPRLQAYLKREIRANL
jgi:hypothetical protein